MYPNELRYTREHEWVRVEGRIATVGITHYAQEELGDVVYVELPVAGEALAAGAEFGTVESV
ncbi:MAG TPA: glycine cleavage system protein H, partial [Chloroflexi bacterium]|nr:glycine cleavage system protein H [Chloroflexota bacterium]